MQCLGFALDMPAERERGKKTEKEEEEERKKGGWVKRTAMSINTEVGHGQGRSIPVLFLPTFEHSHNKRLTIINRSRDEAGVCLLGLVPGWQAVPGKP